MRTNNNTPLPIIKITKLTRKNRLVACIQIITPPLPIIQGDWAEHDGDTKQIFSYMFDALLFVNASLNACYIFLLLYLSTCCSFVACIVLKKKEVNWSFYPVLTNINLPALSWYKIFLKSRDVEKVNLIPISLYAEFHLPSAAKKTINHASSTNKKSISIQVIQIYSEFC